MALSKPNKAYNIVLVGKTGNGKSATGNTILGRPIYICSTNINSCTQDCRYESAQIGETTLNVIDTPGLMDTKKSRQEIAEELTNIMSFCPDGFHAFILVMRWDVKFTEEELNAYDIIKTFFGPDFLKICIIAFPRGDSFDLSDETVPFETWLKRQEKPMPQMLKECNNRTLLFYNSTKYPTYIENRNKVLTRLLTMISENKMLYTNASFAIAAKERQIQAVKNKLPQLQSKYQTQLSLLEAHITQSLNNAGNVDGQTIMKMLGFAQNILRLIKEDDVGTGLLKDFEDRVTHLILMISSIVVGQRQKYSEEKLRKISEYVKMLKNPPSKLRLMLSGLATVYTAIGGALTVVLTSVIPPLGAAVAVGTAVVAGKFASICSTELSKLRSYNLELKEREEEIDRMM